MSLGLKTQQRGFSLIELLIALLIFTTGALGLAAVQIQAKRNIHEAHQRSLAVALAGDILARMRANPGQLSLYSTIAAGGEVSVSPADCASGSCTPAQLAVHDMYEWGQWLDGEAERVHQGGEQLSRAGLLNPHLCISQLAGEVSVAISWRGATAQSNPAASSCGELDEVYGGGGVYRRLLLLTSYIREA